MACTFHVLGSSVTVSLAGQPGLTNGLLPTLGFSIRFINSAQKIRLSDFRFKILLKNQEGYIRLLKYLEFEYPDIVLNPSDNTTTSSHLILDPYILSKIEEYRESGDVVFIISGSLVGQSFDLQVPKIEMITGISLEDKIPKSDWVEKFLPAFNYKNTFLVEIPKLTDNEKIIYHLDSAWKQKHMGQYDKVLTDCRNALEELRKFVKENAGEKTIEGKKGSIPNWDKYFSSKSRGEVFELLDKVIWDFTSRGAHLNKGINLEDADLALLITHAMINNILKKQ